MSYGFYYSITAKCYRMENCLGAPTAILTRWAQISPGSSTWEVDEEGWLRRVAGVDAIGGFYDQEAAGWQDYAFVVPIIPAQVRSGAVGVAFRVADRNNYYCFLWDDGTLGWPHSQRLVKVAGGVPRILAEADAELRAGYLHMVEVEVRTNRLLVKVNGATVFDYTDTDTPIPAGSYGIAGIRGAGSRWAGVYSKAVGPVDVSRTFYGSISETSLGPDRSELINGVIARELLADSVNKKRNELGILPQELIVYAYTVLTSDFFVQPYFDAGEPVVYAQYGNYYTYAYLKRVPQAPEAPRNFRGTVAGASIRWTWEDVTVIENGYLLFDEKGNRIASLPPNTTSYSEPVTDDGVTVTRKLAAYNNVGQSALVEASVFVPIITPSAPAQFSGQALSGTSIVWSWSASPYAQSYELVDAEGRVIAVLPADTFSYREDGLRPGRAYTRGIRAVRKGQVSATVYATAETLSSSGLAVVPTPRDFRGEALTPRVARWLWSCGDGTARFILFDPAGTVIAQLGGSEYSYIEYDLEPGREYTRILVAVDAAGRMSVPVVASVALGDDFEELPCEELPPPPRYVDGFVSGIGNGDDLLTSLEYGEAGVSFALQAVGKVRKVVEVEEPAKCRVRFLAEGTEQYEVDYGRYELEVSAQPRQDVEYEVTAEVYDPVTAEYHLEADIEYLNCYPIEVPFEADIVGYAKNLSAPPLDGTYQVHCEADVVRGQDVPFNYQLEVTYESTDPQYKALVDIVWIVDYSGSMGTYMSRVAQNASSFVNSLNANNIDFRLAVVAYEASAYKRTYSGKEWTTSASEFASMVQIPTSGGTENGINAILFALNNYSFRSGALKYFVILTDEDADDAGSYSISNVINTLKTNNVVFSCIYNPNDARPYPDIAGATGGTAININNSDWGANLAALVNNIRARVTLTATLGGGQGGTGTLQAVARYGSTYTEADPRTLYQIVSDFIASGQSGLPTDFLTSGYNTIKSYRLIPPAISGVYISLSNGSLTSTDGSVKIIAYSTVTGTSRQTFSTQQFSMSVPAGRISPDTAGKSDQTCRQLMIPVLDAFKAGNPGVVSVTPVRFWVTGSGAKVFTCSPDGFDYVRWYRADYAASVVAYRKRIGGRLSGAHTSASPLLVSAQRASELALGAVPPGCEPIRELACFPVFGWRLGSTPFDGFKRGTYTAGVLEKAPSVAYFIKDVYLPEKPASATIYIASDDGMALYVNGTLVADRTNEAHGWHYWDYTFDITQHLVAGRNRIAVLVDDGYRNAGSVAGSFDCELAVTVNGQTSYPILRGAGNYGRDECMWWYYGLPDQVTTPPRDARGLEWYAKDYGLLDLTAHRVESLTPGAVAFIDGNGLARAYLTRTASSCEYPVRGSWQVYAAVNVAGETAPRSYVVAGGVYGISGPNMQYNVSGNEVRYLAAPELLFKLYADLATPQAASVSYSTVASGNVSVAPIPAGGAGGVVLSTTSSTYRPLFAALTVRTGTFSQLLDEHAAASNPQVLQGSGPAAPLAVHFLGYWSAPCVEKLEAESAQVTKSGTYSLSPDGRVVWLKSGYVEAQFTQPADTLFVQFYGSDSNDGYARIYVDGISYGPFLTLNRGHNYVYVTGLPAGPHTLRVESAGGGDLHIDCLGSATGVTAAAAALLVPLAVAAPELQNTAWALKQCRVVAHNGDFAAHMAPDGSSPVYGYPLRPSRYYTTWRFTGYVYAYEGTKVLTRTADLQPLGRDGRPAEASLWHLSVPSAPPEAEVRWAGSGTSTTVGPDEVIAYTTAAVSMTASGYVSASSPVRTTPLALLPAAGEMYNPAFVLTLRGDANVFAKLQALGGETIGPGQTALVCDGEAEVSIGAVTVVAEREWQGAGPWRELEVLGQRRLRIDVPLPSGARPSRFAFEVEGPGVEARFNNSGGPETVDPQDELILSGGTTARRETEEPWRGSLCHYAFPRKLRPGEEVTVTVAVPVAERDAAYDPLTCGTLGEVHYVCLPAEPGIEATVEAVRELGGNAVLVTVRARVAQEATMPWRPASRAGFYYLRGEERYLHGSCSVHGSPGGDAPQYTGAAVLLRGLVALDAEPRVVDVPAVARPGHFEDVTVEDFCLHTWRMYDVTVGGEVEADGAWHALSAEDAYTILSRYTPWLDEGGILVRVFAELLSGEVELRYDPAGTGPLEARAFRGNPGAPANSAVVGGDGKAVTYPCPGDLAPVSVLLPDGTPLRYVPFVDDNGTPVLENTELLEGNGTDSVCLAYRDIDPATLRIRIKPAGSSTWFAVRRFQLCHHRLRLPFTVVPGDRLEVTYRLKDSFTVRPDEPPGGATILVHSEKAPPGTVLGVYYETSPDGVRRWDGPNLNPLFAAVREGFLWLGYDGGGPERLSVSVCPDSVSEGSPRPVLVKVTAELGSGAPAAGAAVTVMVSGREPVAVITDARGYAELWLRPPFEEGKVEIVAVCGTARATAELTVLPREPEFDVVILPSSNVVYPDEKLTVKARVTRGGTQPAPELELRVSCGRGTVTPASAVTDAFGEAVFTYTPSPPWGTVDVVEVRLAQDPNAGAAVPVYIGETVGVLRQVENRVQDIPAGYSVERLGSYDIVSLATTPPEWL